MEHSDLPKLEEIVLFNYFMNYDLWNMKNERELANVFHQWNVKNNSIILRSLLFFIHGIKDGFSEIKKYEDNENKNPEIFKNLRKAAIEKAIYNNVKTDIYINDKYEIEQNFLNWYKLNIDLDFKPFWNPENPIPKNDFFDMLSEKNKDDSDEDVIIKKKRIKK